MPQLLKRLLLLALALTVLAAPVAESVAAGTPVAGAAKKKSKKCKKKKKGKKGGKKSKCRKPSSGLPAGLPGKPVSPTPPTQPDAVSIQSLQLTENPLLGGTSGSGQVRLSGAAPPGGQPVTLGSSDITRATVPDAVHVAAGQTTATFPISTTAGAPDSVTLTAAMDGSFKTTVLDIVDRADLKSLALDYQCYPNTGLTDFGANVVSLNVRAPDNAVVDLTSDDPFSLAVPSSVTVPQGSFNGVFTVDTLAVTPAVTVTASYQGIDRTDTASVRDSGSPAPVSSNVSFQPTSIVVGTPSTGTVSLDCEAPPGGTSVALSVNHAGVSVPATVTVPAGQLSANFTVTTSESAVAGTVPITATAGSAVQGNLTLRNIGT